MAIVVLCPSCSVRLTLGDDRAGTTFECPKCNNPMSVPPDPSHRSDSLPPAMPPPEDTEADRPMRKRRRHDEDEDEDRRRRFRKIEEKVALVVISWLLIVAGLMATAAGIIEGTTVYSDSIYSDRVHNIGLIAYKQFYLFGGLLTMVLGVLIRMLSFLEATFRISNRGN